MCTPDSSTASTDGEGTYNNVSPVVSNAFYQNSFARVIQVSQETIFHQTAARSATLRQNSLSEKLETWWLQPNAHSSICP